jgi:hypothetical protein
MASFIEAAIHLREGEDMSIFVVGPNEGEQSGGGPIRCRIIEDGSHSGHRLGLIEAMVPPDRSGRPNIFTEITTRPSS